MLRFLPASLSLVWLALGALAAAPAVAQTLPPASRTVYKCQEQGKTHYSDAPCVGAQKIDVEPTRGLNQFSGRERIGADVQRERTREAWAEGIRPVTGMDTRQLDRFGRRQRLTPQQQQLCRRLDEALPAAERAERAAVGTAQLKDAQQDVYRLRKAWRDNRCE